MMRCWCSDGAVCLVAHNVSNHIVDGDGTDDEEERKEKKDQSALVALAAKLGAEEDTDWYIYKLRPH